MSAEEILKKIKEVLEKKIEEQPEFFRFSEENPELFGKIVGYRSIETDWGERRVVDIETEDGRIVSVLLAHKVLVRLFERLKPKEGDWVLIRYIGLVEREDGTQYRNYKMAVLRAEEVKSLEELRVPRVAVKKEEKVEKLVEKPVEKTKEYKVKISEEEFKRIKDYVRELFRYYSSMSVDELKTLVYKAGFKISEEDLPFEALLEACKLTIVGDRVMKKSDAEQLKRSK